MWTQNELHIFFTLLFIKKITFWIYKCEIGIICCRFNGFNSCPDCRTCLSDKNGTKPVFLRYMANDSPTKVSELVRVRKEKEQLIFQMSENEIAMKKIAKELKAERSKNTRLANKIGKLSAELHHKKKSSSPSKVSTPVYIFWLNFFIG